MSRKIISLVLSICFIFQQTGLAQAAAVELNLSGYFARMASSMDVDRFRPVHLRYFSYDSLNNSFKLLLDKGDFDKGLSPQGIAPEVQAKAAEQKLKEETKELLNYFLIGVTLPNDKFWVNLRPDSPSQIIDFNLEETDIGKIMLEADLQLKKDTAQFTSPQSPEGKEYWNRLYKKAEEIYGTENITIPTLTRPWIVPNEIIVRETTDSAYIYKATLKVMLEQDYLKDSSAYNFKDSRAKALNEYSSQLIRELIIPKLTKEVNLSKRYAPLRQVYYSLILSRWFKSRFYGKSGVYASLIDKNDLTNLTSKDTWSKSTYFNAYKKSFADGEYNIKEPVYTPSGQTIRSYFSGGIEINPANIVPSKYTGSSPIFGSIVTKTLTPVLGNSLGALEIDDKISASPVRQDTTIDSSAMALSNRQQRDFIGAIETVYKIIEKKWEQGDNTPSIFDWDSIVSGVRTSAFMSLEYLLNDIFRKYPLPEDRVPVSLHLSFTGKVTRLNKCSVNLTTEDVQLIESWFREAVEKVQDKVERGASDATTEDLAILKSSHDKLANMLNTNLPTTNDAASPIKVGNQYAMKNLPGYSIKIIGDLVWIWAVQTIPAQGQDRVICHIPKQGLDDFLKCSDLSKYQSLIAIYKVHIDRNTDSQIKTERIAILDKFSKLADTELWYMARKILHPLILSPLIRDNKNLDLVVKIVSSGEMDKIIGQYKEEFIKHILYNPENLRKWISYDVKNMTKKELVKGNLGSLPSADLITETLAIYFESRGQELIEASLKRISSILKKEISQIKRRENLGLQFYRAYKRTFRDIWLNMANNLNSSAGGRKQGLRKSILLWSSTDVPVIARRVYRGEKYIEIPLDARFKGEMINNFINEAAVSASSAVNRENELKLFQQMIPSIELMLKNKDGLYLFSSLKNAQEEVRSSIGPDIYDNPLGKRLISELVQYSGPYSQHDLHSKPLAQEGYYAIIIDLNKFNTLKQELESSTFEVTADPDTNFIPTFKPSDIEPARLVEPLPTAQPITLQTAIDEISQTKETDFNTLVALRSVLAGKLSRTDKTIFFANVNILPEDLYSLKGNIHIEEDALKELGIIFPTPSIGQDLTTTSSPVGDISSELLRLLTNDTDSTLGSGKQRQSFIAKLHEIIISLNKSMDVWQFTLEEKTKTFIAFSEFLITFQNMQYVIKEAMDGHVESPYNESIITKFATALEKAGMNAKHKDGFIKGGFLNHLRLFQKLVKQDRTPLLPSITYIEKIALIIKEAAQTAEINAMVADIGYKLKNWTEGLLKYLSQAEAKQPGLENQVKSIREYYKYYVDKELIKASGKLLYDILQGSQREAGLISQLTDITQHPGIFLKNLKATQDLIKDLKLKAARLGEYIGVEPAGASSAVEIVTLRDRRNTTMPAAIYNLTMQRLEEVNRRHPDYFRQLTAKAHSLNMPMDQDAINYLKGMGLVVNGYGVPDSYAAQILRIAVEKIGGQQILVPPLKEAAVAASPVDNKAPETTGGIDFKGATMASATTYETMGSFSGLDFSLPKLSSQALLSFNLDKEQSDINRAIDNGIIVSGQRIKEFMAASSVKGGLEQRRETIITWLAKLGILEETTCCTQESSKEYREALVIADSAVI